MPTSFRVGKIQEKTEALTSLLKACETVDGHRHKICGSESSNGKAKCPNTLSSVNDLLGQTKSIIHVAYLALPFLFDASTPY